MSSIFHSAIIAVNSDICTHYTGLDIQTRVGFGDPKITPLFFILTGKDPSKLGYLGEVIILFCSNNTGRVVKENGIVIMRVLIT